MANEQNIYELYKVTRAQIEHIGNMMSQRVIWLVIAQSFFFSGYAILITGNPTGDLLIHKRELLLTLFPVAALLTILFTYMDIIVSLLYTNKLSKFYEDQKNGERVEVYYPPINGYREHTLLQRASPVCVPVVFIILWLIILLSK